jgi:hypothetical protein
MMLDMVVNLNDFLDKKSNLDLLHFPPLHKLKKSYDRTWKFQLEWAAKLPWVEGVLATNGVFCNVRCKVCSTIDKKPYLLAPK